MKYQIWFYEAQQVGTFTEELIGDEKEAFEEIGFELQHEFSAADKEKATQTFVDWCDAQSDAPNRVERVDLVGVLQKEVDTNGQEGV